MLATKVSLITIIRLMIKITICSIVIGLKNSNFPLIHLPSCYRTICNWANVIGQFNKPITFKVVLSINQSHSQLQFNNLRLLCQYFNGNVSSLSY